jgi:hypothetical protein
MPTLASGIRCDWSYVPEVTHGTTPGSPAMKKLRTIGRNINLTKNILTSSEVRQDRAKKDVRHGFNSIAGGPSFELSAGAYDDWLAALLGSSFAAVNITGAPNLSATNPSTFTRAAGSFVTDGIRVGDRIVTSGFTNAANNGKFTVVAATATTLTVAETTLATEAASAGRTLQLAGMRCDNGTTLTTFTVERRFLDVAQYQVFRGVNPNTLNLTISPESIVGGQFGIVGMSGGAMSGTSLGTPSAAPTNAPLAAFEGSLYEGGVLLGLVTGAEINVDNGRGLQPVVGSKFSPDVFDGEIMVTGRLTVLFQDATMHNKFVNETGSSLSIRLDDINGTDFVNISMPSIKYTGSNIDPPSKGPVPLEMPFQALVDNTSGVCLSIQKS